MNPEELIGMRSEDLSEAERDALAVLLQDSPEASRYAEFANEMSDILLGLAEEEGGPSLEDIRVPRRANRWIWGAAGLLAASALAWLAMPVDEVRSRGAGALPAGSVVLNAVAEGPEGLRPISDGRVAADERVVFWVTARVPGAIVITEDGSGAVFPTSGTWQVDAGEHAPGGQQPLTWRPDDNGGNHAYLVELCDANGACAADTLNLAWDR